MTDDTYTQNIGGLKSIAVISGEPTQRLSIHGMKNEPRDNTGYVPIVICQETQRCTINGHSEKVGEGLIWKWIEKTIARDTRQKTVSEHVTPAITLRAMFFPIKSFGR